MLSALLRASADIGLVDKTVKDTTCGNGQLEAKPQMQDKRITAVDYARGWLRTQSNSKSKSFLFALFVSDITGHCQARRCTLVSSMSANVSKTSKIYIDLRSRQT